MCRQFLTKEEGMSRLAFRAAGVFALVCFALTPAIANAGDKTNGPKEQKGKMTFKHSRVVNAPGLDARSVVADAVRAFEADRKAGKFATAADEKRALRETLRRAFQANRSGAGLKPKATASGATAIDLEGQFQYVWLARSNPDGSVSTACVTDAESAEAFLDGSASSGRDTE
jgi:hypothetical protein